MFLNSSSYSQSMYTTYAGTIRNDGRRKQLIIHTFNFGHIWYIYSILHAWLSQTFKVAFSLPSLALPTASPFTVLCAQWYPYLGNCRFLPGKGIGNELDGIFGWLFWASPPTKPFDASIVGARKYNLYVYNIWLMCLYIYIYERGLISLLVVDAICKACQRSAFIDAVEEE